MGELSEKKKAFVREFLKDNNMNATTAALRAGYAEKSAAVAGCRLLKDPDVIAYKNELMGGIVAGDIADITEVSRFLTARMRDEDEETAARLRAAELVGKRLGMFSDKVNISGSLPVVITGENELPD